MRSLGFFQIKKGWTLEFECFKFFRHLELSFVLYILMSFCHPFQKIVNLKRFLSFFDLAQSRPLSKQKRLKMFTVHINLNVLSFLWNCLWENFATINLFRSILITLMHYMRMSTMKLPPMSIMAVQVLSFQAGSTKLERFLHKNQHIHRKLLNFEFWINGKLSKIGHHFSNEVIWKLVLSKNFNIKNVLLNWYSSMKKNWESFVTFWQLAINPKLKIQ